MITRRAFFGAGMGAFAAQGSGRAGDGVPASGGARKEIPAGEFDVCVLGGSCTGGLRSRESGRTRNESRPRGDQRVLRGHGHRRIRPYMAFALRHCWRKENHRRPDRGNTEQTSRPAQGRARETRQSERRGVSEHKRADARTRQSGVSARGDTSFPPRAGRRREALRRRARHPRRDRGQDRAQADRGEILRRRDGGRRFHPARRARRMAAETRRSAGAYDLRASFGRGRGAARAVEGRLSAADACVPAAPV